MRDKKWTGLLGWILRRQPYKLTSRYLFASDESDCYGSRVLINEREANAVIREKEKEIEELKKAIEELE